MWNRLRSALPITAMLLLAALLRFWGVRWGLPNAQHGYSYHPDEFLTVGAAGMILAGFFPRFYNYPSLYLYLIAGSILFASVYGLAEDTAALYLSARVVTALMGTAAVAAVYWAARKGMGTTAAALIAALILSIAPLHVQHSHFATVDVPSTLFVALTLGFALLVYYRGSWRDYLACGAMAGLAAGTKYNAGLVVLSLAAAHFLRASSERPEPAGGGVRQLLPLLAGLGAFIVAFAVSTPAAIFKAGDVWNGIQYEMRHASEGHGLVFAGTGNGFVFTFTSSLWYGLGPALAILFVAAAIYGLVRLDRRALVILAFAVPYYALISLSQVRFARYTLPLYPAVALLIAWMVIDVMARLHSRVYSRVLQGLLAIILAGTLLYTVALDGLFVQRPPQDRASGMIRKSIPPGRDSIGILEVPWFYSPPYSEAAGFGSLQLREQAMAASRYQLKLLQDVQGTWPRWVVFADYEVADAERLRDSEIIAQADRDRVDWITDTLDTMRDRYVLRDTIHSRLSALGISFGSTQSLPHDMRYPAPTIWIYERKQ